MANEPELSGSESDGLSEHALSKAEPSKAELSETELSETELSETGLSETELSADELGKNELSENTRFNPIPSSTAAESKGSLQTSTGLYRGISAYDAISRAEEESYAWQQTSAFNQQSVSLQGSPHSKTGSKIGQSTEQGATTGSVPRHSPDAPSRWNASPHFPAAAPAKPQKRLFGLRRSRQLPDGVGPAEAEAGQYIINPLDGSTVFVPMPLAPKAWWEKQPYDAIAHIIAIGGTVTLAWIFGILAAQILPGSFTRPPLQEKLLRQSSRITRRLWQLPRLSQTPVAETRIEAIPLPETGPVLAPVNLPPIERQPLIDELNDIETEIITLDRRVQTIEERLGKPPYQGADVESRVATLRAAIDPPVRASAEAAETTERDRYEPTPLDSTDQLLEIAKLKISLPSDALFSPGQSELKNTSMQDQVINQVLDQLINYPRATVVIRSYSDNQAKAALSREYTLAQANALSDYLQAALPQGYRWVTLGGGQTQPLASNDQDTGRQRNRRIEILIDSRPRS